MLFEMVKNGGIISVYSDLCEFELENAPEKVKEPFLSLDKNQTEFAEITEEINKLTEEYVKEKVVCEISVNGKDRICAVGTTSASNVQRVDNYCLHVEFKNEDIDKKKIL